MDLINEWAFNIDVLSPIIYQTTTALTHPECLWNRKMKSTLEQMAMVESDADFLRVNAFAGTGKTTTLVSYAKARPRELMLYLAFNKSVQLEAARKFPGNVKCVTSHGLAFPGFGVKFAEANKLVAKLRVNEVSDALNLGQYPEEFRLYVSDAAIKTVDRFLASDFQDIEEDLCKGFITPGSGVEAGDVAALAKILWSKMMNLSDTSVGMVHDGYLKMYQLSNPKLRYDTILFDEAQDANPSIAALVESQTGMRKIVVGDSHQQLYSFRGAMNAMKKFKATQTLYLTRSFRFGQEIADMANMLLSTYKNESRLIQGTSERMHIGQFARSTKCTIIARANATLFAEAVQAISAGKKIHFLGGIAGYRINEVFDVYNLWSGNRDRIANPYLKSFKEFNRMDEYAGATDDKELKSLIGLVKKHGSKLPKMVEQIKSGVSEKAAEASIILTTAHKSKGLEFDNVKLTDDYMDMLDDHGKPRKLEFSEQEEANIVYVAMTRAKKALCPFPELDALWRSEKAKASAMNMPEWARPVSTIISNRSAQIR